MRRRVTGHIRGGDQREVSRFALFFPKLFGIWRVEPKVLQIEYKGGFTELRGPARSDTTLKRCTVRLFELVDLLAEPLTVFRRALGNVGDYNFGCIIAMLAFNRLDELIFQSPQRLDREPYFVSFAYFTLPAINTPDRSRDLHTSGQALLYQVASQAVSFWLAGCGSGQDNKLVITLGHL